MNVEAAEAGGNVYDKYGTSNPVARRLMAGFMVQLDELVERTGARQAHEVGCGEGELAIRLAKARDRDARDRRLPPGPGGGPTARRGRRCGRSTSRRCRSRQLDPERHAAELILCCEVLEHLEDPERALDVLAGLARPWLIASVPREPLWRALNLARLSYVGELGNTPGHVNHWSKREFVRFLTRRFEVIETRSPTPWTMALCRVQSPPS